MRLYKQITKKQAGVIFRAYKEEKIEISADEIKSMYRLVDYNGYDDQGTKQFMNDRLQIAIEKIFGSDYEGANAQLRLAFR